ADPPCEGSQASPASASDSGPVATQSEGVPRHTVATVPRDVLARARGQFQLKHAERLVHGPWSVPTERTGSGALGGAIGNGVRCPSGPRHCNRRVDVLVSFR